MKKWMYLIFPGLMLGSFLIFFFSHQKETEAKEKARMEVAKKLEDDKAKAKAENERKAAADAKERQLAREKEDAEKVAAKQAKIAAADKEVKDATDKALAEGDKAAKEVSKLEIELDTLRKAKDKGNREAFDLAKQVELAKVAKRNAEFEIQRTTEMISKRAGNSSLTRMPPPPPLPPVGK
jgi:chromosome segregation ATPase